ncbi:hypothetical protein ACLKA7_006310 [Drosophila subpalustris]
MDDAKPSNNNNNSNKSTYGDGGATNGHGHGHGPRTICSIENHQSSQLTRHGSNSPILSTSSSSCSSSSNSNSSSSSSSAPTSNVSAAVAAARKRQLSNSNLVNDLEILDRELSAINAPMPLIDPEITQGAEQLEKASLSASRKRLRSNSEDESDRLVREALSQFYMPPQRLISAIEDCPLDVVGLGVGVGIGVGSGAGVMDHNGSKRAKLTADHHLELVDFDMNQNQKDFEVIMDALRLGTPSPPSGASSDSCGQAAMMSESASVFHNLVVTSLET